MMNTSYTTTSIAFHLLNGHLIRKVLPENQRGHFDFMITGDVYSLIFNVKNSNIMNYYLFALIMDKFTTDIKSEAAQGRRIVNGLNFKSKGLGIGIDGIQNVLVLQ